VEKRILAIAAADEDTADFGGVNYNELFATYHNNDQIGDPILLNDDIFGIIAAAAADDVALEDMAQDALDYLIAHQGVDGGFSYTTDTCAYCGADSNDTAAAIIALEAAESLGLSNPGLDEAKSKAITYLMTTKQADGGFAYDTFSPSDGSSTAWVLMALNALGDDVATEASAARDWLLANQNSDGGFSYGAFGYTDSDAYTTAHAVVALLGSTWLLQPAPLEQPETPPATATPTPTSSPTPTITVTSVVQTAATPAAPVKEADDTTEPEVLSSETTEPSKPAPTAQKEATPAKTEQAEKKSKGVYYGSVFLILVAIVWFVLQSKSKQGKKS
jgi:hypothetical protein